MNKEIEKAIEFIKPYTVSSGFAEEKGYFKAAITALEAQQSDAWIPVTERLPEPYKNILAWVDYGGTECFDLCCADDKGEIVRFNLHQHQDVKRLIAWRVLPEPWKEEQ
jgi:hypothetical protein